MIEIYETLSELVLNGRRCAVCTVVATQGSTPRKTGSKMIVTDDLKIYGTIGGGTLEKHIIDLCPGIINKCSSELVKLNLTTDLAMKCGGYVEVFIEPVSTPFKLLIFGGGHIGKALSEIASNLSFSVSVIDERTEIFSDYRQNNVDIIIENFEDYLSHITIDNYTFIVVVTKGHDTDLAIMKKCIRSNYAYIGVIGSQRKSAELKKTLIDGGFCDLKDYERVHIPVGTQIMAEGPFEIAVSIASELILQKNKLLNEINSSKES